MSRKKGRKSKASTEGTNTATPSPNPTDQPQLQPQQSDQPQTEHSDQQHPKGEADHQQPEAKPEKKRGRNQWPKGPKLALLESFKDLYKKSRSCMYHQCTTRFIELWGYDLRPEDEPVEGVSYEIVDINTFTGTERELEQKRRDKFYEKLKEKIGNWARYHWDKKTKDPAGLGAVMKGFVELSGPPPRKPREVQFYQTKAWDDGLEEAWESHWKEIQGTVPKSSRIAKMNEFCEKRWEAETEEFRTTVRGELEQHHKQELAARKERKNWKDTPTSYARAWAKGGEILPPLAESIAQFFGSGCMILMFGPRADGKISVDSVSATIPHAYTTKPIQKFDEKGYSALHDMCYNYASAVFPKEYVASRRVDEDNIEESTDTVDVDSNSPVLFRTGGPGEKPVALGAFLRSPDNAQPTSASKSASTQSSSSPTTTTSSNPAAANTLISPSDAPSNVEGLSLSTPNGFDSSILAQSDPIVQSSQVPENPHPQPSHSAQAPENNQTSQYQTSRHAPSPDQQSVDIPHNPMPQLACYPNSILDNSNSHSLMSQIGSSNQNQTIFPQHEQHIFGTSSGLSLTGGYQMGEMNAGGRDTSWDDWLNTLDPLQCDMLLNMPANGMNSFVVPAPENMAQLGYQFQFTQGNDGNATPDQSLHPVAQPASHPAFHSAPGYVGLGNIQGAALQAGDVPMVEPDPNAATSLPPQRQRQAEGSPQRQNRSERPVLTNLPEQLAEYLSKPVAPGKENGKKRKGRSVEEEEEEGPEPKKAKTSRVTRQSARLEATDNGIEMQVDSGEAEEEEQHDNSQQPEVLGPRARRPPPHHAIYHRHDTKGSTLAPQDDVASNKKAVGKSGAKTTRKAAATTKASTTMTKVPPKKAATTTRRKTRN
ncbi:hypothetical protein V5O48_010183 [Marasmius crinis-equi]|uniref:Uncharacterized protein n=1 Tax=Marasmius crinis-equi TaxID=585013 RepID=A0ABR3F9P2_9AGAR